MFKLGDEVRIGNGRAAWTIDRVSPDGLVVVARTIGVGRLGRYGRTTRHYFGPGQLRPVSDLHPINQKEI